MQNQMSKLIQRLNKQIENAERRIAEERKRQDAEENEQALKYATDLSVQFQNAIDVFLRPIDTQTKEEFDSYLRETQKIRSHCCLTIEGPREPKVNNVDLFINRVLEKLEENFGLKSDTEKGGCFCRTTRGVGDPVYWSLEW